MRSRALTVAVSVVVIPLIQHPCVPFDAQMTPFPGKDPGVRQGHEMERIDANPKLDRGGERGRQRSRRKLDVVVLRRSAVRMEVKAGQVHPFAPARADAGGSGRAGIAFLALIKDAVAARCRKGSRAHQRSIHVVGRVVGNLGRVGAVVETKVDVQISLGGKLLVHVVDNLFASARVAPCTDVSAVLGIDPTKGRVVHACLGRQMRCCAQNGAWNGICGNNVRLLGEERFAIDIKDRTFDRSSNTGA